MLSMTEYYKLQFTFYKYNLDTVLILWTQYKRIIIDALFSLYLFSHVKFRLTTLQQLFRSFETNS